MLELFLAEFKRSWIQYTRYPAEALGGIFITTVFFYALFLGSRYMAGPTSQFGDRLETTVVGYILWTLVIFIVNDVAINLQVEAQTGTLEQVFLSPFGGVKIFLARALASLILRLGVISTILGIILLLTGSQLQFSPNMVLPLFSTILGAYGLAFALGSLALIFKRIQQVLVITQFCLLFLLATPMEQWQGSLRWVSLLLPMTEGAGLLRDLMARGGNLNWGEVFLALMVGSIYFGLGLGLFRWAVAEAKRRGILGTY